MELTWDESSAHSAVYDAERTADLFCLIVNRFRPIYESLAVPATGAEPAAQLQFLRTNRRQHGPGRLANVPFDRMQPVTTVRDVRHAEVLAGWQQIFDAARNQAA